MIYRLTDLLPKISLEINIIGIVPIAKPLMSIIQHHRRRVVNTKLFSMPFYGTVN